MELAALDEFVNANPLEFVPTVVFWGHDERCRFLLASHVLTFHLIASPRLCVRTWTNSLQLSEAIATSLGVTENDATAGN